VEVRAVRSGVPYAWTEARVKPRIHIELCGTSDPDKRQLKIHPLSELSASDHAVFVNEVARVWEETKLGVHPKAAVRAGIIRLRSRGFEVVFDRAVVDALETLEVA
jgi:hypothetical protein